MSEISLVNDHGHFRARGGGRCRRWCSGARRWAQLRWLSLRRRLCTALCPTPSRRPRPCGSQHLDLALLEQPFNYALHFICNVSIALCVAILNKKKMKRKILSTIHFCVFYISIIKLFKRVSYTVNLDIRHKMLFKLFLIFKLNLAKSCHLLK